MPRQSCFPAFRICSMGSLTGFIGEAISFLKPEITSARKLVLFFKAVCFACLSRDSGRSTVVFMVYPAQPYSNIAIKQYFAPASRLYHSSINAAFDGLVCELAIPSRLESSVRGPEPDLDTAGFPL